MKSWKSWLRILLALLAIGAGIYIYTSHRDQLTLESFAQKERALDAYQKSKPLHFWIGYFAVYVAMAALSIPGATLLTVGAGRFFGLGMGVLLVSFASTLGATLAFLVSRFVIGDSIREKYGEKLSEINQKLEKEGPFYLFSMRLIPAIPFFLINLLMGLTPVKTLTFWWVSQVGMLAGTIVYVYAGAQIPTLQELSNDGIDSILTPGLIVAFIVLAAFPFLIRKIMAKFFPTDQPPQAC